MAFDNFILYRIANYSLGIPKNWPSWVCETTVAECIVPDWGDKVNSGIGPSVLLRLYLYVYYDEFVIGVIVDFIFIIHSYSSTFEVPFNSTPPVSQNSAHSRHL
jgi:hypothetical protein